MAAPATLVVYVDYACPYSRLAEGPLARLEESGVAVERRAFELRPPGSPLPEPGTLWTTGEWQDTLEPLAAELGLVLRRPSRVVHTRKAHEAAAHARSEGAHAAMHEALLRAYWEEGRDIGRIDVLVEIGAGIGLDRGGLRVALDIDQRTDDVVGETAAAMRLGVTGVPTYLLAGAGSGAGEMRAGVLRYDELTEWVANR